MKLLERKLEGEVLVLEIALEGMPHEMVHFDLPHKLAPELFKGCSRRAAPMINVQIDEEKDIARVRIYAGNGEPLHLSEKCKKLQQELPAMREAMLEKHQRVCDTRARKITGRALPKA